MSNASSEHQRFFRRSPAFGHPVGVVFNVLAVFIVGQIIAGLLVEIGARILSPDFGGIDSSAVAEFFFVLLAEAIAVLFVFWVLRLRKLPLSSIGLGRPPAWRDLTRGLIGFGAFYGLLIVFAGGLTLIFPNLDKGTQDVGFNTLNSALDMSLAFFALVFLPPLGEEILVRGYLYSGLRAKMKFLPALLITSLIFGSAHIFCGTRGILWGAELNTFVLSVVLVYLRESTGALYAGMLVHMLNNLIAFGVHFH
jgi:membrane protease YdiL (CAAX protease family)